MNSEMSIPNVVALVVTYNRRKLLEECLNAILQQTYPLFRILVIDNASNDGTGELFAEGGVFHDDDITYIRMTENLGGAGGFKRGIAEATALGCDWVWLMDDDCIPDKSALEELVKATSSVEEEVSFMASRVYGMDNEPMNVPVLSEALDANGYRECYRYLSDSLVEIESATFVSLLISAKAVAKVGLPVGSFFIWGDDTEYTMRLTRYYGKAYLVGRSSVLHKRVGSAKLSVLNETDPTRMENYSREVCNRLVRTRYYKGITTTAFLTTRDIAKGVALLFVGEGNARTKRARSTAVLKGVKRFITFDYDIEDMAKVVDAKPRLKAR